MVAPGRVEHIHIAPEAGAPMEAVETVEAVAGRGLRGDRYFGADGTWSSDPKARDIPRDVTLFEAEVLDVVGDDYGLDLVPADHRRNLTVSGIALDHVLGERLRVGEALLEAVELCEPCAYLESLTDQAGTLDALVHRGGLNAAIIDSGTISVGDPVAVD